MSTIQTATETLIRLAKQSIHPDVVAVFADDLFEVQSTPSLLLQGPKLTEDRFRRKNQASQIVLQRGPRRVCESTGTADYEVIDPVARMARYRNLV